MLELLLLAVALSFIASLGVIAYLIYAIIQERQGGVRMRSHHRPRRQIPQDLERELARLAGSQKTARRLVAGVRVSHPTRSERWCWEKAIADLDRDRRAR